MTLKEILGIIMQGKKVAIFPHVSADGDALGSSIALAFILKKLDKQVKIFLEEKIPDTYAFLPGREMVCVWEEAKKKKINYDTAIALDNGDLKRLASRREIFGNVDVTLNIDHHTVNTGYAMYNYVDDKASAVGEIVFHIMEMLGVAVDHDIALCLYIAIATDTGGFRFSNTTSLTHKIVSNLIDTGIDVAHISRKVFDEKSYEKVKLIGAAADSLELLEGGKLAVVTITDEAIQKSGAKDGDLDGLVNIAKDIRGVEAAILLREVEGSGTKINLRSNYYVDVSEVAKVFSGGGHTKAAGCTIESGIEEARRKVVEEIGKRLKQ